MIFENARLRGDFSKYRDRGVIFENAGFGVIFEKNYRVLAGAGAPVDPYVVGKLWLTLLCEQHHFALWSIFRLRVFIHTNVP